MFQEGNWRATGRYFDHEANQVEIYGETMSKHLQDEWVLDGHLLWFGELVENR